MDPKQFTSEATGKLVPISHARRGKDWSFVPHELPVNWEFPTGLWPVLGEVKEALGRLSGTLAVLGQEILDPNLLLLPLQTREAIASSSIEGTYVTPQQLLLYELDPHEPLSSSELAADSNEVLNYGRALRHGFELLKTIPICKRLMKEMHGSLMAGVRGRESSPGEFRKCQVQIGSSGRFIPPPPDVIEPLIDNLEKYINQDEARFDPLVRCYVVHYQFEAIHPFKDGNGRVGRALLALMTAQWLGHSMPWLYMSAFFEQYREEYVSNLFNVSAKGDWERWIAFCLEGTIAQANDSIRRCNEFYSLRTRFHSRVNAASSRTHPLIEALFRTPILTISWVSRKFNVTYHTAQTDIERLVKAGILHELPGEYPRTFIAKEIMDVAYGPNDKT